MEEQPTIPPEQQGQDTGQIGGTGAGPVPVRQQAQQTGTIVAEREHAPPATSAGKGDDDIADQTQSRR